MKNISRKLIAANWKMNLVKLEAQSLVAEVIGMVNDEVKHEFPVVIFPSFVHLGLLASQLQGISNIIIGAQDCSAQKSGAFTGEVSASMIAATGAKYVLVGHSERRQYHNESNILLLDKIKQAIDNSLTPIFCFGESLNDRESNNQNQIVIDQLSEVVFKLSNEEFTKCKLAYEPVWAIGTGKTANVEQVAAMHSFIRSLIVNKFGNDIATNTTILYGGSCNEQNANELFAIEDVDGGLIGGASLKSRSFVNIIKSF